MKDRIEVLNNKIIIANKNADDLSKALTQEDITKSLSKYIFDLIVITLHVVALTLELKAILEYLIPESNIKGQKLLTMGSRSNKLIDR